MVRVHSGYHSNDPRNSPGRDQSVTAAAISDSVCAQEYGRECAGHEFGRRSC